MKPQQMIELLRQCDPNSDIYFVAGDISDMCPDAEKVRAVESGQVLVYSDDTASYFNTDLDLDYDSPEPQNAILIY
jgi:hypothetical protein